MFREAPELKAMKQIKGRDVYLENNNPKVRLQVISKPNRVKFGKQIRLECGDTIIITFVRGRSVFASISVYLGYGVFNEEFFMYVDNESDKISAMLHSLNERERIILKSNLAALAAV